MAKKQELNSLERFRKRSERLVLEEHSHCEVPAGCGGVVLRWRTPEGLAYRLHTTVYSPFTIACGVDGAETESTRTILTRGRHVLTLTITDADPTGGLFLFAAVYGDYAPRPHLPADLGARVPRLLSADDGTWKYAVDDPPPEWTSPTFDDSAWPALVLAEPLPEPARNSIGHWSYQRCVEMGAVCLRLPPGAATGLTTIDVRKTFDIVAPFGAEPVA
jgi:hypothetical protein